MSNLSVLYSELKDKEAEMLDELEFRADKIESLTSQLSELKAENEALKGGLMSLREFISQQDINVFGSDGNGEIEWPKRDEIIDNITRLLPPIPSEGE